ncbi:hypothetical protein [Lolliginicoccus levis]|uniref:hypothetical protein n=1 Tax=Lolliginicoccus levis TaxID=2919542 RepID=UPI00241EBA9D|nr:hypothetical protein [Lolliginicoccus levis]
MKHSKELVRALEMVQQAAPQSQALSELFTQVAEQVRYVAESLEHEARNLPNVAGDYEALGKAQVYREGAACALREESRRWQRVAKSFADAPEDREANPTNYAYVRIGREDPENSEE